MLDEAGECLEGHAGALGRATNNVAEYNGLLQALRLAVERGAETVEILTDSELMARQIQGRYRVKHPDLKPLFAEAKRMIGSVTFFTIRHVRREQNKLADRLVNRALDRVESDADPSTVRIREIRGEAGS